MIYGSVCSGIEAATVAWKPLGWAASFFSEIEKFPRAVLAEHFPDTPLHGDFTTIEAGEYEPIDILVGGTPCQSFSVAGLRSGLDDDRGNLALEYLRLAKRLRPKWLVWENVPGVLSSGKGRDFGAILGGLVKLRYGWAYRVLDAQNFGVPQRRRRVFVVGYSGDWRPAAAVLFERESLQGHPAPRRETGERVADSLTVGANQCSGFPGDFTEHVPDLAKAVRTPTGGIDREDMHTLIPAVQDEYVPETSYTVSNKWHKGTGEFAGAEFMNLVAPVSHSLRGEGFDASEDGTGRGTPLVPVAFTCKDYGADAGGISPTLRAMGHDGSHPNGGGQVAIAFETRFARNGRGAPDTVVPPLKAQSGQTGKGDAAPCVATAMQVRRLTPRECERLQGFPDDYTQIPWRGKTAENCPDGPRYKALGNSMAVPVMRWIGQRIAMVERLI